MDIVRRKLLLVTIGTSRVKALPPVVSTDFSELVHVKS